MTEAPSLATSSADVEAPEASRSPAPTAALGRSPATTDADADADPLAAPLPPSRPRRRVGRVTMLLTALLLLAAGFFGGVLLEHKHDVDNPPPVDNPFAALAARFGTQGGTGGTGQGGAGGAGTAAGRRGGTGGAGTGAAGSSAVTGTVQLVDGDKLYVQQADGTIATFTLAPDTQISRIAQANGDALAQGASITVTGDGSTDNPTARSIAITSIATPPRSG